jgi:gamma-glutamyltranspeptidase/glutathione hydrolase
MNTAYAARGMVVAPHHLAAQAGLDVLREGGNAIEAAVATAAAIAVVYPHMNSLGGDNFWLIGDGGAPIAIDACGAAAARADPDYYRGHGCRTIPTRGPLAALTVAGAVSGWQAALELSARWGGRLPLARLLADAIAHARAGFAVTATQAANTLAKRDELKNVPGFDAAFLANGAAPAVGTRFVQAALAVTLEQLGRAGLDDFYRGAVAEAIGHDLAAYGSPVAGADLAAHFARTVEPLAVQLKSGTVYNMPPPTQGLASLMILGLFDRLAVDTAETFAFVHGLVECTKEAFRVRDSYITDPVYMKVDPGAFLKPAYLDQAAVVVDMERAAPFASAPAKGDTVWFGTIDGAGRTVSAIQSIYWEFGSGVVLPQTGITWQNRGVSFSLEPGAVNELKPGRRPFHTIQPALAHLNDGRRMVYGTMGGDGQPQTQAMVYARHVRFGQDLGRAIASPRWVLGRTWGTAVSNLRIESRLDPDVIARLRKVGQDVAVVEPMTEIMGHAGAIVHRPDGIIYGSADPRGDGIAAGF